MPTGWNTFFRSGLSQFGQTVRESSEIDCWISNSCPQFLHLYSYRGIVVTPSDSRFYTRALALSAVECQCYSDIGVNYLPEVSCLKVGIAAGTCTMCKY